MAKIVKKSVIPIYAVAAVWAVWALLLPLYHAAHFVLAAAVSTVAWAVARKVCKDTVLIVPDPKPEPVSTGDPALDALIAERDRALSEMKRLNASIEDPVISAHIDHLETVTGKIISHVVAHPDKQSQIRRFMDYYLPTTLKLLNAYDRMDETGISGANIDGTKGKITDMMSTISTAFDRQLDALFGGEAMDISTDITVMEQMLAREGLGGTQLGS
ncbi:MAG: hypothetical protein HFF09_02970 [Oscillospiraceae bacterium]|nr:hypothetical protein [Oscillospiraceae bacterium]